jgi:hypothetical protein
VVLPVGGHDHVGCLLDQVKLTCALNKELNQAMKEIHQQGDHRDEANWRITELESLCMKQEEFIKN